MSGPRIRQRSIRGLVLDIDGVLTDGTVAVGSDEERRLYLRDLDAIEEL